MHTLMGSISNISHPASTELTYLSPLQKEVADKLRKTTNKIVKDVITVLVASKSISVNAFIDTYVLKQDHDLSKLDQRTQKFSQQLLAVVNEDLNKIPTLSQSFNALASYVKDPHIRQKLVTGIALPSIKELVLDFDAIKTSIIEDINACYKDDKPSWKDRLLAFMPVKCPRFLTWQKTAIAVACAIATLIFFYSPYDSHRAWRIRSETEEFLTKPYGSTSDYASDSTYHCLTSCRALEKCSKLASTYRDFISCKELSQTFNTTMDINMNHLQESGKNVFSNLISAFFRQDDTNNVYKQHILQNGGQNCLAKIDSLIQRECCFDININRSLNQKQIKIDFQLKSHCQIA